MNQLRTARYDRFLLRHLIDGVERDLSGGPARTFAVRAAEYVRAELELDAHAYPLDVSRVVRGLGVEVAFSDSIRGGGELQRRGNVFIMQINAADIRQRQRFTIAHEFGHIVLGHADEQFRDGNAVQTLFREEGATARTDSREWNANEFAACLLVPEAVLRVAAVPLGYRFDSLANFFDVSRPVIDYRMWRIFGGPKPSWMK